MILTDFVQLTMSCYVGQILQTLNRQREHVFSSGSNLIFIAIYISCMFIDSSILYNLLCCCILA